jgi:lysophospholipase L1-like esterase
MNICIFGDSITWGADDPIGGGWADSLKDYCQKNFEDVDVFNLGISGDTTTEMLKRFKIEASVRNPDLIIFAIGINDSRYINSKENLKVNFEIFRENISKLSQSAKKFTKNIVFVGLTRVDESRTMPLPEHLGEYFDNENIEKYDSFLSEYSLQEKFKYINMKSVVNIKNLPDGLHPDTKGHKDMFETILKSIKKFL